MNRRAASIDRPPRLEEIRRDADWADSQRFFPELEPVFVQSHLAERHIPICASKSLMAGAGHSLAVHLAIRSQWKLCHLARTRKASCSRATACRHVHGVSLEVRRPGRLRYNVGDQSFVAGRVLARHHNRLVTRSVLLEHRLDFAQLNPEAANLHLVIDAPRNSTLPSGLIPGQISGAIHARFRLGTERIRNELLRRQFVSLEITARQTFAADIQFSLLAICNRLAGSSQECRRSCWRSAYQSEPASPPCPRPGKRSTRS